MPAFFWKRCLSVVAIVLSTWMTFVPAGEAAPTPVAHTSLVPAVIGVAIAAKQSSKAAVNFTDRFRVPQQQKEAFLERWQQLQEYMKKQPGFISAELNNKPAGSPDWVMSEDWQSVEAYKAAVSQPEFQALVQNFPAQATWFARDLFPTQSKGGKQ